MANIAKYQVKRNRSSVHIAGINELSKGSQLNYARSACPALSRGTRLETTRQSDTLEEALDYAKLKARVSGLKLCKNCEQAADITLKGIA